MTETNSFVYNSKQHTASVKFNIYPIPNCK